MKYWRMQLHPDESARSAKRAMQSLGLGYIGLDFANPPGDLTDVKRDSIPQEQRDYWDFAHEMKVNDIVLIVAHHHPIALVRVVGEYNYVRNPEAAIGVWFRHFRKVELLGLYADLVTNPKDWEKLTMTDTISVLKDQGSASWRLVDRWLTSPL